MRARFARFVVPLVVPWPVAHDKCGAGGDVMEPPVRPIPTHRPLPPVQPTEGGGWVHHLLMVLGIAALMLALVAGFWWFVGTLARHDAAAFRAAALTLPCDDSVAEVGIEAPCRARPGRRRTDADLVVVSGVALCVCPGHAIEEKP